MEIGEKCHRKQHRQRMVYVLEYRKRCKVCGKIWCYTDEDLRNDRTNDTMGTIAAIGGIANLLGGGSIFHQQYFADRAEHSSDQVVDRHQCPHCHSRDIEDLTQEEWDAAQSRAEVGSGRIAINSNATPEALLRRARLFLEDGDWTSARAYCENVLDADPENAEAYVIKLMATFRVKEQDELGNQGKPFDDLPDYQKALRFSDDSLAALLKGYIEQINNRIKQEELDAQYEQACATLAQAQTEDDCRRAAALFAALPDYKDSTAKEAACHEKGEQLRAEEKTRQAERQAQIEKEKAEAEARAIRSRAAAKKYGPIAVIAAVVIIAATLVVTKIIIPSNHYKAAEALEAEGYRVAAAMAFGKAGGFSDARERASALWDKCAAREVISAGSLHTVGLKSDGTVVAVGSNSDGQCNVSGWSDVVAISAGRRHTVGLKSDGTVVAVGSNSDGQCNVSGWSDVVAISAGSNHTVGLKSDGTVVAVGYNDDRRCDVFMWTEIIAIAAGGEHTVGLRSDGTVVATGKNNFGSCDVSNWTNITAISAGEGTTVGLKSSGTVVVASNESRERDLSKWRNIIAVSEAWRRSIGLKSDGTVVAEGEFSYDEKRIMLDWADILAVSASHHTVGLKSDGTVVVAGHNIEGECNVSGWSNIKVPNQ